MWTMVWHGYIRGCQGSCVSGFSLPFCDRKGDTSYTWWSLSLPWSICHDVSEYLPTNHLYWFVGKYCFIFLSASVLTELLIALAISVVSILCFMFASLCSDSRWKHSAMFGFSWLNYRACSIVNRLRLDWNTMSSNTEVAMLPI